jgi:hypothetical protein
MSLSGCRTLAFKAAVFLHFVLGSRSYTIQGKIDGFAIAEFSQLFFQLLQ